MADIYTVAGLIDKDGNEFQFSVESVGDLQDLHTAAKNTIVAAVNEVKDWQTNNTISNSEIDTLFE